MLENILSPIPETQSDQHRTITDDFGSSQKSSQDERKLTGKGSYDIDLAEKLALGS